VYTVLEFAFTGSLLTVASIALIDEDRTDPLLEKLDLGAIRLVGTRHRGGGTDVDTDQQPPCRDRGHTTPLKCGKMYMPMKAHCTNHSAIKGGGNDSW
jgi:hypothetical protein